MRKYLLLIFSVLCESCSVPANFNMYPERLTGTETLGSDMAVVLVGLSGGAAVNYLQFTHSSLPAINVRFSSSPQSNTIVAVPVPVGIKQLSLQVYTIAGRGAGYTPAGMSYGYVTVRTPKIDIAKPGIYYLATVDVSQPGKYVLTPIPSQLTAARNRFAQAFKQLEPVNFTWPSNDRPA